MIARTRPRSTAIVLAVAIVLLGSGCVSQAAEPTAEPAAGAQLVHVPADAATITDAVGRVAEGGLILVAAGTYRESVTIDKPNVTLRGEDRNAVIIDGEGLRANGVQVISDGVRVQNLTVRNHTFNGVLVTGLHDANGAQAHSLDGYTTLDPEKFPPLQRFEVSSVTASNNGLYGIYAFNSQHGVISDNYASGSADSGFYVGQCPQCDILVTRNVAENNAIGYENANASDSVLVAGNRFTANRVGLTLLSWYQEAYLPQKAATVVGNLIGSNNSAASPAQANGAFGIGVGLSGAQSDVLERNLISGNASTGLQLANTEDIASTGTRLTDNVFTGNGLDFADISASRAPSSDTCITGSDDLTVLPAAFELCASAAAAGATPDQLPAVTVPPGISFLKVIAGPAQPQLDGPLDAIPARLPDTVAMPDAATFAVPDASLFADRVVSE